ncbi:MAG TPA: methionyl-tRNA formyltransferase [Aquella sp.]|nr:methionyl-tRNA formyltransferase [Aquella sp.]
MQQPLKIIFAGTPEISKITLEKLLAAGFKIDLVLTQMDRPAGRGKKLTMSPVKQLALEHNIEVFQPQSFKNNPLAITKIRELKPDIVVVVAYGLILPQEFLDIPTLGCVNIHVSLLPHLRGAAPIARAIIAGDTESGVTIMQMDAGLDTGAILLQQSVSTHKKETTGSLHDKLANLGANMITHYLNNYKQIKPIPQDNTKATYAHKIDKSEAQIDFNENALTIERKIRGFNPHPGCFTYLDEQRLLIWEAETIEQTSKLPVGTIIDYCNDGILVTCGNNSVIKITELQLAGRKRQSAKQFGLGYPGLIGKNLF